MNKRKTGTEYEELAARWLTGKGFEILEKKYRCRIGEIDLIARDGRYLVFVEVKYRSDEKAGLGQSKDDGTFATSVNQANLLSLQRPLLSVLL